MMHALLGLSLTAMAGSDPSLGTVDYGWQEFPSAIPPNVQPNGYSATRATLTPFFAGRESDLSGMYWPETPTGYAQVSVQMHSGCQSNEPVEVEVCGFNGGSRCSTVTVDPLSATQHTQWTETLYSWVSSVDATVQAGGSPTTSCDEVILEWVEGHQQEMSLEVTIDGVDRAQFCQDHQVRFNGQDGDTAWCPDTGSCIARIGDHVGSPCPDIGTDVGMWFPDLGQSTYADSPHTDHFLWAQYNPQINFENHAPYQVDPNLYTSLDEWAAEYLPYQGAFFAPNRPDSPVVADPELRTILIELATTDPTPLVTDRSRTTYWRGVDGTWRWLDDQVELPGSYAMLTPSGLSSMAAGHLETLPYPSADAFDDRLSGRALGEPHITSSWQTSRKSKISGLDSKEYFKNPDSPWAGSVAYDLVKAQAQAYFLDYGEAVLECGGNSLCITEATTEHCVTVPPTARHFKVVVDNVDTFFDPALANPAVLGSVSDAELSFLVPDQISSELDLRGLHGELRGDLMPHTSIEYKSCVGGPRPSPVHLRDHNGPDHQDLLGWTKCEGMTVNLASGSGISALRLTPQHEMFDVEPATLVFTWDPGEVDVNGATGCSESFLEPDVEAELTEHILPLQDHLRDSWLQSPSQEEAMKRLVSPTHVGLDYVDVVPPGTPTYTLYPQIWNTLEAHIGATPSDANGFFTDPLHGMYTPYMTRAEATVAPPSGWLYPCFVVSGSCDVSGWTHADFPLQGVAGGAAFDVASQLQTESINQSLAAQALDPELLGSSRAPHVLAVSPDPHDPTVGPKAAAALAAYKNGLQIEVRATVPPFVRLVDQPSETLLLAVPQIVVELVDGSTGRMAARFLVDVIERDLDLKGFSSQGVGTAAYPDNRLLGSVANHEVHWTTTEMLPGCEGEWQHDMSASSACEAELRDTVRALVDPHLELSLEMMLNEIPMPGIWDIAQEVEPREVRGPTMLTNGTQSLLFVGTLATP